MDINIKYQLKVTMDMKKLSNKMIWKCKCDL